MRRTDVTPDKAPATKNLAGVLLSGVGISICIRHQFMEEGVEGNIRIRTNHTP